MIFKSAQMDKYIKNPDKSVKGFVVYGANEGLQAECVKSLIKTVSSDVNDPFQVVYLNCSDINSDAGVLYGEYGAQSLMGGRRVIVVQDADNNNVVIGLVIHDGSTFQCGKLCRLILQTADRNAVMNVECLTDSGVLDFDVGGRHTYPCIG